METRAGAGSRERDTRGDVRRPPASSTVDCRVTIRGSGGGLPIPGTVFRCFSTGAVAG
jgi:hypothetical protein